MGHGRRGIKKHNVSKAVKKYVKEVIDNQVEDKYLDTIFQPGAGGTATNTTGGIFGVSAITQGTQDTMRVGDAVRLKEIEWDIVVEPFLPIAKETNLRVILFMDHQAQGTGAGLPIPGDILQTVVWNAFYDMDNIKAKRFSIIMDRIFELDPYSATFATTQTFQHIRGKKKMRNVKMVFAQGTTSTPIKNAVYALTISDQATATSPAVTGLVRLVFEDA